jgi:hypothetical protein
MPEHPVGLIRVPMKSCGEQSCKGTAGGVSAVELLPT